MNKLMGFYELKSSDLPTVPWKEFRENTVMDDERLWTVRSAVFRGDDISLPRLVGVTAHEATLFAQHLKKKLGDNGIVLYYPYFKAEKSGTLNVFWNKYVIEAVEADLWNLVTDSQCNVTIQCDDVEQKIIGDDNFLSEEELCLLKKHIPTIKRMFRDDLLEGRSVLLEWSFAYQCDGSGNPVGERYLVFYEVRTI